MAFPELFTTSQNLEVMNKAHIVALTFRTTFRVCFKISIHEQVSILGKVPDQPGADGKNLFFQSFVFLAIHLGVADLVSSTPKTAIGRWDPMTQLYCWHCIAGLGRGHRHTRLTGDAGQVLEWGHWLWLSRCGGMMYLRRR